MSSSPLWIWSQDSHDVFAFLAVLSKSNVDRRREEEKEVDMEYSQECKMIPAILAPARALSPPGRGQQ